MAENAIEERHLQVVLRRDLGGVNLRGDGSSDQFREAIKAIAGRRLPESANRLSMDDGADGSSVPRIYWLGPDEWLIVVAADAAGELVAGLEQRLAGQHVAINDLSAGLVFRHLSGDGSRELLAKGCTLDLHVSAFATGDCAQSGLAKAGVTLGLIDAAPTFELIVRSSFSDYLGDWLLAAGAEYGISSG